MNKNDIEYISGYLYKSLFPILPSRYDCEKVIDAIINDVIVDIEEYAEKPFLHCDIKLALSRVLVNRLTKKD